MTLYHLSEEPDIACFSPRPAPDPGSGQTGLMVWAIDDAHLHNYLLPRDCPRVTFYSRPDSHPDDVMRLMGPGTARAVVAIEHAWFHRLLAQRLYVYEFSGESFTLIDAGAGYYISRETVVPQAVTPIDDLAEALFECGVELRVLPSLWPLRDAVAASSLSFSMIRMRNAQPRPVGASQ